MEILKLDFNERADGAPAWVESALRTLAVSDLWKYPDRTVLERKLAERYGLRPDQVLATAGGDEGINLIFRVISKEKKAFVLPLPAFTMYHKNARDLNLEIVEIQPLSDLRFDLGTLAGAIAVARDQWVVLTNPNNPTGEKIPLALLKSLIESAAKTGAKVLLDEAYAEFSGESLAGCLDDHENLVVLRTFSKAYGLAGARCGYLLGSPAMIEPVRALAMPFNVSALSIYLAEKALEIEAREEMETYCRKVAANRETLLALVKSRSVEVVEGAANFLLVRLGAKRAELCRNFLRRRGILVRKFDDPLLAGCLRITIPLDLSRLIDALSTVLNPEVLCLDMDGTLVDVRDSFDSCVIETVFSFSGRRPDRNDLKRLRNAGGFNDDWRLTHEILGEQGIEVPFDAVKSRFENLYFGDESKPGLNRTERSLVTPRLRSVLDRFQLAVVTGRSRREVVGGLELLEMESVFTVTIEDVENGKPDPEGIFMALNHRGASRGLMVGDNVDDVRAAVAAGVVAVGVGMSNAPALYEAGADLVVEDVSRLEELL